MTLSALASTFGGIVRPICFRRFQIDDELELRRLLHRKIGGLGAFQDLIDKVAARRKRSGMFAPYVISPPASTSASANIVGNRLFVASSTTRFR